MYQLYGINQVQMMPQIGLSFAPILRAMLRHDPDVTTSKQSTPTIAQYQIRSTVGAQSGERIVLGGRISG